MNSRMKGQIEFIVIAALIIIAISAVILATRQIVIPTPGGTGLTEEEKTIKDSVVNLMRAGAKDQLLLIYNQGGTLKPSSKFSVKFGAFDTAVWSACNETIVPDVSKEIGAGIWAYLRENLKDEMDFYGKNVKFDFSKPNYKVDIMKDRINVQLYLPTKIEGHDIQQPYEISVATKLYDILDFSENLVNDRAKDRYFEMCTLRSIMTTDPTLDTWLPFASEQTGCGNNFVKTRSDLLPGIKGVIKYTVSHIVFNTQPPKLAENQFYPLNVVGGKFYPDLQVAFAYPPSWDSEIDKLFTFAPNPLMVTPRPIIPFIPICMAPYVVFYNFRYPIVVMVEDSTLSQWFKFAMMVDIQNTQPGNCSAALENVSEYTKTCVTDAECNVKITVQNSTGSPIEGADTSFYICDLGTTNSKGVAEGKVSCTLNAEFHVYKEGYRSFGELLSADELSDKTVKMEKVAGTIKIHFKGLETKAGGSKGEGRYDTYNIKASSKDMIDLGLSKLGKNLTVFAAFLPANPDPLTAEDMQLIIMNYDENGTLVSAVNTSGLQPIEYNVTATVATDDGDKSIPVGYINTSFVMNEGDKELYIYIPVVSENDDGTIKEPGINPDQATKLTDTLLAYNSCTAVVGAKELPC